MVVDMGYWTKVGKRILVLLITILGIYLAFKLAIFYSPFLIAFIISLLIEPIIKFTVRKTKLTRKVSSIIVLIVVFTIIIGLLVWGIVSLISEATNLLQGLNEYIENAYNMVQNLINGFEFDKIQIPEEVMKVVQSSLWDFIGTISNWVKNGLTSLMNGLTAIPNIAIYVVVTLLAIYFICTDKLYMLDQLEHHFPEQWVKKIGHHLRELIATLGSYLKAEMTLVLVSFIISVIGLYLLKFMGFNLPYPLLAALLIGFVDALPILGSGTVMLPWAVIIAINGDINLSIGILVLWTIMSVVRQFIEPRIVSKNIGVHPIFTLIAMYTGFRFIGVLGMLVGPIVLIILKNVFSTMIDKGVGKAIFGR